MDELKRVTGATLDVLEQLLNAAGPMWGLLVIKATGRPAGTIYPILDRLERLGWVHSEWDDAADRTGPRRRQYKMTGAAVPAARTLVAERRRPAMSTQEAHA